MPQNPPPILPYDFRWQAGAPAYTSVLLEHVFGGILRYFEIFGDIFGRFGGFWGHLGPF